MSDGAATIETRDCLDPWRLAFVHANGDVTPCCWAGAIGSLKDAPLEAILAGEAARDLRERMLTGRLHADCAKCPARATTSTAELKERVARHLRETDATQADALRRLVVDLEEDRIGLARALADAEDRERGLRSHAANLEAERAHMAAHIENLESERQGLRAHAANLEAERAALLERIAQLAPPADAGDPVTDAAGPPCAARPS